MEEKIKKLEQQIERETKRFNDYLEKGKELKNEYVSLIMQEIKNNIIKEIETFVKTDIDNTYDLGLEELSKMKKEMKDLLEFVDSIKDDIINNSGVWKISKEFINNMTKNSNYYDDEKAIKSNIEKLIKKEFVKTGDILIKYSYLKDKGVRPWEKKGDTFVYDCNVWLSEDLTIKVKNYTNIFSEYLKCNKELIRLNQDLKEAKALSLWEQA